MNIQKIRHSWPEAAGFELNRPEGAGEYILLHFLTPVELSFAHKTHHAPAGTLIVFRPDTGHRFFSKGPLLHNWMHLTGAAEKELARFGLAVDTLYSVPYGMQITERVARLETEFFARKSHWNACLQALLEELWINLSRQLTDEMLQPISRETADRLRTLRAEMILHPEAEWTNEQMAKRLNISISRLYPLYHSLFSISPRRDLILMRIEKAENLLRQGYAVSQTAELLGYGSTYHFIRQFRKETGITPGRWAAKR